MSIERPKPSEEFGIVESDVPTKNPEMGIKDAPGEGSVEKIAEAVNGHEKVIDAGGWQEEKKKREEAWQKIMTSRDEYIADRIKDFDVEKMPEEELNRTLAELARRHDLSESGIGISIVDPIEARDALDKIKSEVRELTAYEKTAYYNAVAALGEAREEIEKLEKETGKPVNEARQKLIRINAFERYLKNPKDYYPHTAKEVGDQEPKFLKDRKAEEIANLDRKMRAINLGIDPNATEEQIQQVLAERTKQEKLARDIERISKARVAVPAEPKRKYPGGIINPRNWFK